MISDIVLDVARSVTWFCESEQAKVLAEGVKGGLSKLVDEKKDNNDKTTIKYRIIKETIITKSG